MDERKPLVAGAGAATTTMATASSKPKRDDAELALDVVGVKLKVGRCRFNPWNPC
jgi:hypothetical protein